MRADIRACTEETRIYEEGSLPRATPMKEERTARKAIFFHG